MIILPEADLKGAIAVAENLGLAVSTTKLRRKGSDTTIDPLTLSLGVSTHNAGKTSPSFIDRADQAPYRAKHAGRNRVVADDGTQHKAVTAARSAADPPGAHHGRIS